MTSRRPPSQRDANPQAIMARQARALQSMSPGTMGGRLANAARIDSSSNAAINAPSEAVEVPEEDSTIPSAPTILSITSATYKSTDGTTLCTIAVGWSAVTTNTDATAITDLAGYQLQLARAVGEWEPAGQTDATTLGAWANGFKPGITVYARVRALDSHGHFSAWSTTASVVAAADTTPPNVPSTPVIDSTTFFGTLRVKWDGLDSVGGAMPVDWSHTEVHTSASSGFTPSTTTMIDSFVSTIGAISSFSASNTANTYVKFIAVDRSGNRSAPSAEASGTTTKVITDDIYDNVITAAKIPDSTITGLKLAADTITAAQLAPDAVTASELASGAVTGVKIADNSVTAPKMVAGTITAASGILADAVITTAKIGDAQILSAKIADGQIVNAKIGDGAITNAKIVDATILNAKIGNLQVDDAKIGSCSIGKLTVGSLTADMTVSARIKTANSGLRAEINSGGFYHYDSSGVEDFSATSAGVSVRGGLRTAQSGARLEVLQTGGVGKIFFYSGSGSEVSPGSIIGFATTLGIIDLISPTLSGSSTSAGLTISSSNTSGVNGGAIFTGPGYVEVHNTSGFKLDSMTTYSASAIGVASAMYIGSTGAGNTSLAHVLSSGAALQLGVGSGTKVFVKQHDSTGTFRPIAASAFDINSTMDSKENIRVHGSGLEALKKIRPVSFDRPGSGTKMGVIAEEVAAAVPIAAVYHKYGKDEKGKLNTNDLQAAIAGEEGSFLFGVDLMSLVSLLIGAVQELEAKVETLTEEGR